MRQPAYLDSAATTRVDERVADVILRCMREEFGNSGSRTHQYGADAMRLVEEARTHVAALVGASSDEVIFTSGATEANNLAILGTARALVDQGRIHVITTAQEHKAVLEPIEFLQARGVRVTLLSPGSDGRVDPDQVHDALDRDTGLVSVMHVNNETGVIQPLDEIAAVLEDHSAYMHVDAAQGFGKHVPPLKNRRIDLLSISGHKVYGPKGVGALIARKREGRVRIPIEPLMFGGGQERGIRPGTLAVPLIAGLGEAARLAAAEHLDRHARVRTVEERVLSFIDNAGGTINGDRTRSLPHIINASFKGLDSEAFIVATKDLIAVSNGAACSSHSYQRSHVLVSMGLPEWQVASAIRFSLSHETTFDLGDELVQRINRVRF